MNCLDTALAVHNMGLPVVIVPTGEKGPHDSGWPSKRYTKEELIARYTRVPTKNVGLPLGPASGLIDVELDEVPEEAFVEIYGGPIPSTPSWKSRRGGHRLFKYDPRLDEVKKAVVKINGVEFRLGCGKKAAQSLLPPSTTDGVAREWIVPLDKDHPPAALPDAVIEKILAAAADPEPKKYAGKARLGTPGGDFNAAGDWNGILTPHGWTLVGSCDGTDYWRRPGKDKGISATTGYCKTDAGYDLLYVFTSNAPPFKEGKAYSRFAAYALLNHGGDFKAAAEDLREKGFGKKKERSVASILVDMLDAELFHTPASDAYMTVAVNGHKETLRVDSKAAKHYLGHLFYSKTGGAPSTTALSEAANVIAAKAKYDGPAIEVYTRVAEKDGFLYLDRGDSAWEAVKIGPDGYEVVADPPVKFRRPNGLLEIPRPVPGGKLDELKRFVNCDDKSWPLVASFSVGAMNPRGPYPIALFMCDQGSCKSFSMKAVRRIIDPNEADLRGEPENVKDLVIAAQNGRFVALDNLSRVRPWLSDALCRTATGGGLGCRELYTNGEEALFRVQASVMVTAIDELTSREDFLDRCLLIHLPAMSDQRRNYEEVLLADYEEARPRILGALLTAVSAALKNKAGVKLERVPRMADFARWVTAAEPGLGWEPGTFMKHYLANRKEANWVTLNNPLAAAILALVSNKRKWSGTATQLLAELKQCADSEAQLDSSWPRGHNALSGRLHRMRLDLQKAGVLVNFKRRTITLTKATKKAATKASTPA